MSSITAGSAGRPFLTVAEAADELAAAQAVIDGWGGGRREVLIAETVPGVAGTGVVRIVRERDVAPTTKARRGR